MSDVNSHEHAAATPPDRWELRYTWEHAATVNHPRFTFETAPTESLAIDLATRQLDRMHGGTVLRLIEAHRRHTADTAWIPVEWTPPGRPADHPRPTRPDDHGSDR